MLLLNGQASDVSSENILAQKANSRSSIQEAIYVTLGFIVNCTTVQNYTVFPRLF
jgi:hypothetical protein